jgi:hypothetical protein
MGKERVRSSCHEPPLRRIAGNNLAAQTVGVLLRDDKPHAAGSVSKFTRVTRNDVKMEVKNSLTGCGILVEADIESVWAETLRYDRVGLVDSV